MTNRRIASMMLVTLTAGLMLPTEAFWGQEMLTNYKKSLAASWTVMRQNSSDLWDKKEHTPFVVTGVGVLTLLVAGTVYLINQINQRNQRNQRLAREALVTRQTNLNGLLRGALTLPASVTSMISEMEFLLGKDAFQAINAVLDDVLRAELLDLRENINALNLAVNDLRSVQTRLLSNNPLTEDRLNGLESEYRERKDRLDNFVSTFTRGIYLERVREARKAFDNVISGWLTQLEAQEESVTCIRSIEQFKIEGRALLADYVASKENQEEILRHLGYLSSVSREPNTFSVLSDDQTLIMEVCKHWEALNQHERRLIECWQALFDLNVSTQDVQMLQESIKQAEFQYLGIVQHNSDVRGIYQELDPIKNRIIGLATQIATQRRQSIDSASAPPQDAVSALLVSTAEAALHRVETVLPGATSAAALVGGIVGTTMQVVAPYIAIGTEAMGVGTTLALRALRDLCRPIPVSRA